MRRLNAYLRRTVRVPIWMLVVGGVGLALDLAFHWDSSHVENHTWAPGPFLKDVLMDAPAHATLLTKVLGVCAHVGFIGTFILLIYAGILTARRAPRSAKPR